MILSIYFVEFLDKHASGLGGLIFAAIIVALIVGLGFALGRE